MKKARILWLVLAMVVGGVLSYVGAQQTAQQHTGHHDSVTVEMKNVQGESVGNAVITATGNHGVRIKLNLKNLPPGAHGFHFHEIAKCEAPDFTTAGEHFSPFGKEHGLKNPRGAHVGDMVNINVSKNGTTTQTITNKHVMMGTEVSNSLFDSDGTALIVHADADDQRTDPSGNSGDRIACGVVSR